MPDGTMRPTALRAPYHHGGLEAALIAAARAIAERDGPDGVSLRAVARAAGVSQAAPYHHFADKDALLAAVAAEGFRELRAALLARAEAAGGDPFERLRALAAGYVGFARARPALFRLMETPAFQRAGAYRALDAARQKSYLPLADAVAECLPGASRAKRVNACAAVWSLAHGMAILASDGRLGGLVDLSDLDKATDALIRQLNIAAAPGA
ncbi:MAG: TetR family transcriptional regulator [Alphaproteobacteria bacterium]|nr:TetR family transcriptional regulator [Alphaproteobacteria bacterium]